MGVQKNKGEEMENGLSRAKTVGAVGVTRVVGASKLIRLQRERRR